MSKLAVNSLCMLLLMVLITWPSRYVYLDGWNDFLSFYAGGRLAFTDQLYDPAVVSTVQSQAAGTSGPALRFIRLPHYAMLLSPLCQLEYMSAYILWQFLNLTGVITAVWLWPYSKLKLAHVFAVWPPLYWAFINGQDLGLMICGMSAAIRYISRRAETKAAVPMAACLIKFHFLWLVPITLIRRPRALLMFAGITATLLASPLLVNPGWPQQYYRAVLLSRSVISNTPCSLFPVLGPFGLLLGGVVAAVVVARYSPQVAFALSVSVAVAVSPHAYFQDYSLLAPLVALYLDRARLQRPATNTHRPVHGRTLREENVST